MAAQWTYSTTVKAPQPAQLSLSLSASSPTPSSLDSLLDSTTPALGVRVTADGALLDPHQLAASAVIAEVRDWLDKNKSSIAVDQVGSARSTPEGISIALHAFSRSARAATLSLKGAIGSEHRREGQPAPDGPSPSRLASLDLSLDFRSSAGRPRKRARLARPDTPPPSASQPHQQHPPGGITLAAQLLDASGAPLHFALAGLVEVALTRWAKKLVGAFPLCFNARWIARVSGDLAAQHSIAGSLKRILGLEGGGELQAGEAGEVEDEAAALMRRLNQHLSTAYPARFPSTPSLTADSPSSSLIDPALLSPPPSPPLAPAAPAIEPVAALEAALLLLATRAVAPDPWAPPPPSSVEQSEERVGAGGSRGRRASSGRGKKGGGRGERVRGAKRGRARLASADDDDMLLDDDPPSRRDSPPLDFDAGPTSPTPPPPRAADADGTGDERGGDTMSWQLAD
ncbi:hypothetical protein JCM3775_000839 [Rhodotorula graminis]